MYARLADLAYRRPRRVLIAAFAVVATVFSFTSGALAFEPRKVRYRRSIALPSVTARGRAHSAQADQSLPSMHCASKTFACPDICR